MYYAPGNLGICGDEIDDLSSKEAVQEFVKTNIEQGYILDGMQRLNTLLDASELDGFIKDRPIYVNVIIAKKYDLLLYRMITLNNGQKPMTARHQIEMLTGGAIDLSSAKFAIMSEKDTETNINSGAFRKSDIIEAYTAFLTDNVNNQNKKIIESKLDKILVGRVMDTDIASHTVSFSDILKQVDAFVADPVAAKWLRGGNNLIGFTVGAKKSLDRLNNFEPEVFSELVNKFEDAFKAINTSKVNVGKLRRELVQYYISNIDQFYDASTRDVETAFFEFTMTD